MISLMNSALRNRSVGPFGFGPPVWNASRTTRHLSLGWVGKKLFAARMGIFACVRRLWWFGWVHWTYLLWLQCRVPAMWVSYMAQMLNRKPLWPGSQFNLYQCGTITEKGLALLPLSLRVLMSFYERENFSSCQLILFFLKPQLKAKMRAECMRLSSSKFCEMWVRVSRLVCVRVWADLKGLLDDT